MDDVCDITFAAMGSDVRLIVEAPLRRSCVSASQAAERERLYVEDFTRRLSRFRDDSELSALNGDPRSEVPVSPLLRTAIAAGLWAAQRSGGLVDPTLVGALEDAGYGTSHDGWAPASLSEALAFAPPRRVARPDPQVCWRTIEVDERRGVVRRPAGLKIDTGGVGKGLCADAVAHRLGGYRSAVVDCGGDIAVAGVGAQLKPLQVEVEHPLSGERVHTLSVAGGGVATSGLNVRIWRREDGGFAHHLLDPSSGQPVWSGLIGATALAPTALEAETLAKMALLGGAMQARRCLAAHGGLIVHDEGEVELIGLREGVTRGPRAAGERPGQRPGGDPGPSGRPCPGPGRWRRPGEGPPGRWAA